MNKIILILFSFFISQVGYAQQKYWVVFNDKNLDTYCYSSYLSEACIQNRNQFSIPLYQYSDAPVDENYLQQVKAHGVQPIVISRWLNAISAHLTFDQVQELKGMRFVKEVTPIQQNLSFASCGMRVDPAYIHIAMRQMQINSFVDDSLSGKGVAVGVIDAGFYDAQNDKMLKHLFEENRILGQKDFLDSCRFDLIEEKATEADYHGRMVLDMIAGYNNATREMTGMAPNASFYLARTEHGDREFRGEEDSWIEAMEWMDRNGVRLISTSLGYSSKMDDPNDNYTQKEMDGKTTKISRGAQIATLEKGIFLVVSAGNEGGNPSWGIVSSPADAEGVLSVGATKSENCERIEYSSIGPEFLPYIKPNVSCYSPNGTSFSAPAVAGFVACLMQKSPTMDNRTLKKIIEKSAHIYPYGNNYIGYGIPRASRALKLLRNPSLEFGVSSEKKVSGKYTLLKIANTKKTQVTLFHKKNDFVVIDQKTVAFKKGKLKVRKIPHATRTTVSYSDTVIELIWE